MYNRCVKFTVPITNKISLNKIYGGVHWTTRKKHRDEYHTNVWAIQPKKYTGDFPVHISYSFKFKGRKLDASNCVYMLKLIEDGLVECGVIPDDNPKYVRSFSVEVEGGDNEVEISIDPV